MQLRLSYNGFGCNEVEPLGKALKQNSTLVLLDLSWNFIDDRAIKHLCQGLATNDTLKVLQVSAQASKCWAVDSWREIWRFMFYYLQLSNNPMSDAGALMLLETVKNNTKSALVEIDISVSEGWVKSESCLWIQGDKCLLWIQTVLVRANFVELWEEVHQMRPALDVKYSFMKSVTRNITSLKIS